ncbi:MAG: YlbL family protein [Chloroflexota bacterium]
MVVDSDTPDESSEHTAPAVESDQPANRNGWRRWRPSYLLVPLFILLIAAGVLEILPANVYILLPGEALPVAPMIAVPGHPAILKRGQLLLTDVSLYKANHKLEELWGRLNSSADVQPAANVAGGLSDKQFLRLNLSMMDDSIHQAEAAALNQIPGDHPRFAATGPRIVFVQPGTPASKLIHSGDVILAVNGRRVHRAAGVAPLVRNLVPGKTVQLQLLRKGRPLLVSAKTVPANRVDPQANPRTALIGISLQDQIVFPVKIKINPGNIGGPSAGLMFSLGVIQRLEKQDITHGCRIAGTGTIDFYGTVGAIGGAKQKIIAARSAGARYFLVPDVAENRDPAEANRGEITVVPVKTLPQALRYLKTIKPCR